MPRAAIAQEFAAAFGVPNDLAHIAAIMHDLGRMGLLAAHPTEYTRLALAAHNTEADIRAEEQAQFGMDHCRAVRFWPERGACPRCCAKPSSATMKSPLTATCFPWFI